MKYLKITLLSLSALLAVVVVAVVVLNAIFYTTSHPDPKAVERAVGYARANGMRTDCVLLCDYSRHSGKPRFWLWDCEEGKVLRRSLCAHGNGKGNTASTPLFSNVPGSSCSSLGMYRVDEFHMMRGRYRSLKIEGLEESNSNAMRRGILIHSGWVSRHFPYGIYPFYIPLSNDCQGCFTIDNPMLEKLIDMAGGSGPRLLLYAYY